jgi:ubiquinone/menaquinone biosynthesis C-methylase UbiE
MNYWDNLMGTDDGAAQYMETYGEGPGCATRMIIGSMIKDGESVLDVGCGPGWNFDHFMKFGPAISNYKGLDYSERFVRVANKRAMENAGTSSGPFAVGDVRNIPEDNYSWDVVLLQDVLEHTDGYEKSVKDALRVARKRVIITFWKSWRKPGDGDQINIDGDDGFGSNYELGPWEEFLNKCGYRWRKTETGPDANRHHYFYVIDKEKK